jgi:hypothetical protein
MNMDEHVLIYGWSTYFYIWKTSASKNGILLINCNIKNSTKRDHKAQESIQSLILGNEELKYNLDKWKRNIGVPHNHEANAIVMKEVLDQSTWEMYNFIFKCV